MTTPLDEVLSAAHDLIKAACAVTSSTPVPVRQRQSVSRTQWGYTCSTADDAPVWTDYTMVALGNVVVRRAAERLGSVLLANPSVWTVLLPRTSPDKVPATGAEGWMGTPVGSSILNRYYATARSGAYAEAAADLAVAVIPAALKRSAARRRLWAPIHGVALSVPEFRLADDTAIRELSDADVADIQSDPDLRFAGHEERHAMELRAVVLHEYAVPLSGPLDTSPALRRVEALVTTMRLLTGHRATLFSSNDYSLDPFLDATSSLLLAPERSTPADGVPIVLSAQILNSLRATWPAVQSLAQNHPNLALALKRFDSAMTRSPAADRLLDAWIGLEALFLSESNAELSYRASIRIPAYLGGSTDERLACHKMVKDSYSLRSKIVHGNPASAKLRPEQTQLVEVTVDLLRRSLLRAVTEGGLDAAAIDRRLLCGPEAGMR